VEDDAALRQLFRMILELRGYHVEIAADGVTALHLIDQAAPPHVVVLDIGLPRLSGLTVAAELAATARTSDIPIIIVTGSVEPFNEMPFAAVLHKPVTGDAVADAVEWAISRRGRARPGYAPSDTRRASSRPAAARRRRPRAPGTR
jgi:CheY-like chemotaxis protein